MKKNIFLMGCVASLLFSFSAMAMSQREQEALAQEYLQFMGFEEEAKKSFESIRQFIATKNPASAQQMQTAVLSERYIKDLNQALIKTVLNSYSVEDLKKTVAVLNTSYGKTLSKGHRKFMFNYISEMGLRMNEISQKGLSGEHK